MSTSLTRRRLRFKADSGIHNPVVNILTGAQPVIWRGTNVQIEVGIFTGGVFVDTFTNIDQIVLEIHTSGTRNSVPLLQKILPATSITTTLTEVQWNTGSLYHAVFELDDSETQFEFDSNAQYNSQKFWLAIEAITKTDAYHITLCGCELTVEEDGLNNGLSVVTSSDPAYRLNNGELQLWNPNQSAWHSIFINGTAGNETIAIGPATL